MIGENSWPMPLGKTRLDLESRKLRKTIHCASNPFIRSCNIIKVIFPSISAFVVVSQLFQVVNLAVALPSADHSEFRGQSSQCPCRRLGMISMSFRKQHLRIRLCASGKAVGWSTPHCRQQSINTLLLLSLQVRLLRHS